MDGSFRASRWCCPAREIGLHMTYVVGLNRLDNAETSRNRRTDLADSLNVGAGLRLTPCPKYY